MRIYSFFTGDQFPEWLEVEYHARFQIPTFQILGLPAPEIQEARERIMAAFQAAEWEFPKKKVIVNLTPASVRKSGTAHDLAIALKIYSENEEVTWPEQLLALGELALDGSIKPCGRMTHLIELLSRAPIDHLILTSGDFSEFKKLMKWREKNKLSSFDSISITVIDHLNEVEKKLKTIDWKTHSSDSLERCLGSNEAINQRDDLLPLTPSTERLLKISLIGKHHVLLLGPKGIGKSEALKWYQALLPPSPPHQVWERLLTSENGRDELSFSSPVRNVHAHVRPGHLLGSFLPKGYQAGELALAHGGLFVADEFMEWPRDSKECLREPLQNKKLVLTRVRGRIEAKCDFQFIATGNLCPCGGLPPSFRTYSSNSKLKCRCKPFEVQSYLNKLSGPILDRIDLTFLMTETTREKKTKPIDRLKEEITQAQAFAKERFGALPGELDPLWLETHLSKDSSIEKLLSDVLSLRSRHKILRVARSIQALEGAPHLKEEHVFEAKFYRLNEVST